MKKRKQYFEKIISSIKSTRVHLFSMLEVDIQPNGKLAYPLEINSYPERLDLPDIVMQEAVKNRVKLIVNTDSHDASQMPLMRYGVQVARRGWATRSDILNALPYNRFREWLLMGGD